MGSEMYEEEFEPSDRPVSDRTRAPAWPVLVATICVVVGVLTGMRDSTPAHLIGYVASAYLGLLALFIFWAKRNARVSGGDPRRGRGLERVARVLALATVGVGAMNVWQIAYAVATRR